MLERLKSSTNNIIKDKKNHCDNLAKLLKANDYHEILKRGFALLKNEKGNLISSIAEVKINKDIIVEVSDGAVKITTN